MGAHRLLQKILITHGSFRAEVDKFEHAVPLTLIVRAVRWQEMVTSSMRSSTSNCFPSNFQMIGLPTGDQD